MSDSMEFNCYSVKSEVDWDKLKGRVETVLNGLNDELLSLGIKARFEFEAEHEAIKIFLSRDGVSGDRPELTVLPDDLRKNKVGFDAIHAGGARPAGLTVSDLKPQDVPKRLSSHLLLSLEGYEMKVMRNLHLKKEFGDSPEVNVLG